MSEPSKRKFGPTRGEYLFRLCAGLGILALAAVALMGKGMPDGIMSSESILFGTLFAAYLTAHSGWKLAKGDYRVP